MEAYRIADEPRPRGLASCVVYPFWPFLAGMFGGAWLSWPWFILNGVAVGSPTLVREVALVVVGFIGSAVLALTVLLALAHEFLNDVTVQYAQLALTVWKLAICYWLYALQGRTFSLYEYYGGQVKSGLLPFLIAGVYGKRELIRYIGMETPSDALLSLVLF